MKVPFWAAAYLAVAAALLAVALVPSQGEKDFERGRMLSAELGLISVLTSRALEARSPDELADSLAGYRPGCSIHVSDANGSRLIVGEDREVPPPAEGRQELVVDSSDGSSAIWRFQKNADGSTVVASAHVPRAARGPGRALGFCGLVILCAAGCVHAALSRREKARAVEPDSNVRPGSPVRGVVSRPGSRRALGLGPSNSAGLSELAKSELLKRLVRKVRRCA